MTDETHSEQEWNGECRSKADDWQWDGDKYVLPERYQRWGFDPSSKLLDLDDATLGDRDDAPAVPVVDASGNSYSDLRAFNNEAYGFDLDELGGTSITWGPDICRAASIEPGDSD